MGQPVGPLREIRVRVPIEFLCGIAPNGHGGEIAHKTLFDVPREPTLLLPPEQRCLVGGVQRGEYAGGVNLRHRRRTRTAAARWVGAKGLSEVEPAAPIAATCDRSRCRCR